jgi:hypothetical protein
MMNCLSFRPHHWNKFAGLKLFQVLGVPVGDFTQVLNFSEAADDFHVFGVCLVLCLFPSEHVGHREFPGGRSRRVKLGATSRWLSLLCDPFEEGR